MVVCSCGRSTFQDSYICDRHFGGCWNFQAHALVVICFAGHLDFWTHILVVITLVVIHIFKLTCSWSFVFLVGYSPFFFSIAFVREEKLDD